MSIPEIIPFGDNLTALLAEIRHLSLGAEVFIWELVRNSYYALLTMRLESLVEETELGTERELFINIVIDKENNSLSVIDTGIGMTKADLVDKLCFITDPDLRKYMDAIDQWKQNSNLSCIYSPSYVCLGFFSAYMVAEKVVITTKQNGHDQYVWESDGCGSFSIALDTTGDRLVRGTKVTFSLKKDEREYLDDSRLKVLVANYPFDRCPYPISVSDVEKRPSKRQRPAAADAKEKEEELLLLIRKFEGLRKLFAEVLEGRVENVVVSDRVYELSSNLSADKKTLEINPRNKKMEQLRCDAELNPKDEDVFGLIWLEYLAGCGNLSSYDRRHGTTYLTGRKLFLSSTS